MSMSENAGTRGARILNRKIHIYFGLYFLLFIWLFAFSGLLLNHHWEFAEFYQTEEKQLSTHPISIARAPDDETLAHALAGQLGLRGEVSVSARSDAAPDLLKFQVGRAGTAYQVSADLAKASAEVEKRGPGTWRLLHTLHTFTGVSVRDETRQRNWAPTWLWVLAMDGLAIGLLAMVATGIYLWWQLRSRRLAGLAALGIGIAISIYFVFGIAAGLG
jgi:hypothetical protein